MAAAGGRQPVDVDEEALVRVARVVGEHAMVNVLLGALALVAGGQRAARGVRVQARLQPRRLGVVVHVVNDDAPLAGHVLGAARLGVGHVTGADVAGRAGPVGHVVRTLALGGARVEAVVEGGLLLGAQALHQIVGRLGADVGVLLGEQVVLRDGRLDLVGGVLGVLKAVGEGRVGGAGRGRRRVAVVLLIAALADTGADKTSAVTGTGTGQNSVCSDGHKVEAIVSRCRLTILDSMWLRVDLNIIVSPSNTSISV